MSRPYIRRHYCVICQVLPCKPCCTMYGVNHHVRISMVRYCREFWGHLGSHFVGMPLLPRFHGKTVIIPVMDTIRAALYNYWLVEAITPQQLMSHFMDLTSISVTPGTSIHTGLLIMIGTFTHIIDCTVNYCYDLLSALTGLVNNYFE